MAGLHDVAITGATLEATGTTQGGQVTVASGAGDVNFLNAIIQTNGGSGLGGTISFDALNSLTINGQLSSNSLSAKAGQITLVAKDILLGSQANLQATGSTGGGTILVGGDWQGSGSLRQATTVTMNQGAVIDASATQNGNGGKVVLWSDIHNINSVTVVHGTIFAKAGLLGGNGGQVETSGFEVDSLDATVSTKSIDGKTGLWLIDPTNYTIGASQAGEITNALASNNLTITTSSSNSTYGATGSGVGDITINSPIYSFSTNSLSLVADNNININADIVLNGNFSAQATNAININANVQNNGSQTYTGPVNIATNATLDTTFGISTQAWSTYNSTKTNAGSFSGAVKILVQGAAGGTGGSDGCCNGMAGGVAGSYTATYYLASATTLYVAVGDNGVDGSKATGVVGGAGGVNALGFNGAIGGTSGGVGSSGSGGGGGGGSAVQIGSGTAYVVAGGAGGGAGANNISDSVETTGQPYNSGNVNGTSYAGSKGKNANEATGTAQDGGGAGGGGGGYYGGAGGLTLKNSGDAEVTGYGGYAGGSGSIGLTPYAVTSSTSNVSSGQDGTVQISKLQTGVNAGGAITFSSTVTGNTSSYTSTTRLVLTGAGAYQVWAAGNTGYYSPFGNSGTATSTGTANSTGASLSSGALDGTLKWDGTNYSWIPNSAVTADYLLVGGGASSTRGVYGIYWGQGGGGGQVSTGTMSFNGTSIYTATVGAGGAQTASANNTVGNAGASSVLDSAIANGGSPGSNITTNNAGALGGTSGSGYAGGNGGATGLSGCAYPGYCGAGGGGGSGGAGAGLNGGAGTTSSLTGAAVTYAGGGAGKNDNGLGTASAGGGVGSAGTANTGGGGSDTGAVGSAGGSGLIVMAFGPGLTIKSGAAQVSFGGAVGSLSSLNLISSATSNQIANAASSTFALNYTGTSAGLLTISAVNTAIGNLMVNSGTVKLSSTAPVGPSAGSFVVANGGVLDLNGQTISNTNPIKISGSGISSGGALINSSATAASYAGAVTLGANASIGGTGDLTLSGVITAGSYTLSLVNGVGLTATNTANNIQSLTLTGSSGTITTNQSLTLNASSIDGHTLIRTYAASKDITVSGALTSTGNGTNLTLYASRNILVRNTISGATSNPLNVYLYSSVDKTSYGAVDIATGDNITTYGGNITIRGGADDPSTTCAATYSCNSGYAIGNNNPLGSIGISITTATLNAAGGNVALYGRGNSTASTAGDGIKTFGATISTSGTGSISIYGVGTGGWNGVIFVASSTTGTTINGGTGAITISGTPASGNTSLFSGIRFDAYSTLTTSGDLTLIGTNSAVAGNYPAVSIGYDLLGGGTSATRVSITVGGNLTINATGGTRGLVISGTYTRVAVTGDISITSTSTSGASFWMYGTSQLTSSAGTLGITSTSTSSGTYGIYQDASSLISSYGNSTLNLTGATSSQALYLEASAILRSTNGTMSITASAPASSPAVETMGSAQIKAAGNLIISATINPTSNNTWALIMRTSSLIESTGGTLSITAMTNTAYSGGIYLEGSTIIRSAGDLSIYANQAPSQADGALYINGSSVIIRSTAGNVNLNLVGSRPMWLVNSTPLIQAYLDLNINAVGTAGIYVSTAGTCSSSCGWISDTGNISVKTISNDATGWGQYALYVRAPIIANGTATGKGNVTIVGVGPYGGIDFDSDYGYISAKGNVDVVGYGGASGGNGVYIISSGPTLTDTSGGTIRSVNGNVTISGYSAWNVSVYLNSSTINIVSTAGNIAIQGASLSTNSGDVYTTANTAITNARTNILSTLTTDQLTASPSGYATANASMEAAGKYWGTHFVGGKLLAVNNPSTVASGTAPMSGGSVTVSGSVMYAGYASTSASNSGAGVSIFDSANIYSYGDISITGDAASAGIYSSYGANHGIMIWSTSTTIRSYNGSVSLTGYANGRQTVTNFCNDCTAAGVYSYSDHNVVRAKNNLTITGINLSGVGVELNAHQNGTEGWVADTGNIVVNGMNNYSAMYPTIIRQSMTATAGNITITGTGVNSIAIDTAYGSLIAAGNINLIGYATTGYGVQLNTGVTNTVRSTGGNIVISSYSGASTSTYYAYYQSSATTISASQHVIFQGATLSALSTGNGILINAATAATPVFASADSAAQVTGPTATRTIIGDGAITATSGYIKFAGSAEVAGLITAGNGITFSGSGTYSLTNTSNSAPTISASVGTGALTYKYTGPMTIGTVASISGITAGAVILDQNGTSISVVNRTTIDSAISASSLAVAGGQIVLTSSGNVSTSGSITLQPGSNNALEIYKSGSGIVSTGSGAIKLGGDGTTNSKGVYFSASAAQTVSSAGGNINFYGDVLIANPAGLTVTTSSTGTITFGGRVDSGNTYQYMGTAASWTAAINGSTSSDLGFATDGTFLATPLSALQNSLLGYGYFSDGKPANYYIGARKLCSTASQCTGSLTNVVAAPGTTTSTTWAWVVGPAANNTNAYTQFFTQGGSAVSGFYTNWYTGEPNGTNYGEYIGQMRTDATGTWNDLPNANVGTFNYIQETNKAPAPLTLNTGTGLVTINGAVGGVKPLASVTINAALTLGSSADRIVTAGNLTVTGAFTTGATTTILDSQGNAANGNTMSIPATTGNGTISLGSVASSAKNLTIYTGTATFALPATTVAALTINSANTGTSAITQSGALTESGLLTLNAASAGVMTLSNASNAITGGITVSSGTLKVSGSSTLGTSNSYSGTLSVATDAIFDWQSTVNQTFSALGSGGTGGIVKLNASSGTVTISGNQSFNGVLNVAQAVTMSGGSNASNAGLGSATAININSGGTITMASGQDNAFIGSSLRSSLTLTINTGGTLTSVSGSTNTFHLNPGSLVLAGGTLGWGGTTTSTFGSWNLDHDITVTDDSTISAKFLSITQSGGTSINVAAGKTLTLSGTIISTSEAVNCGCDSKSLKINAASGYSGTVILSGSNTYTGSTAVYAGTLILAANAPSNSAGALGKSTNAVLLGDTTGSNNATLLTNGAYTIARDITVQTGNSGTMTIGVTGAYGATFSGNITLNKSATLTADSGGTATFQTGAISGTGFGITKAGAGTVLLSGTNTYTGNTTVNAGTLTIPSSGKIYSGLGGAGPIITVNSGATFSIASWAYDGSLGTLFFDKTGLVINGGTLRYTGSTNTAESNGNARGFTVGASGAVFEVTTSGATWTLFRDASSGYQAAFNGDVTLTGAGNGVMANYITGSGALLKTGAGAWTLSGVNTYNGGTTISVGTLKVGSATALGASSGAVSITSGAALDLNGQTMTNTNALTINGTGITNTGALTNSSATNSTYAGSVSLASATSIGSTAGAITISGAISDTNNYGLALIGNKSITLSNTGNTLSTIASGSSMGAITVVNNANLTIGSVTAGSTYTGLDSTGIISVKTTRDLTISQNVATTSTSATASAPALLLAAGSASAIGSVTYNIIFSGSPTFTIGTGGIADFYSGGMDESTGLHAYITAKTTKTITYESTLDTEPSAAGFNVIYRASPPIVYLTIVNGQTGTYGTASSLSYWYSTSATLYGEAYVPSSLSAFNTVQTFTAGQTSITINSNNLSGTIAISTSLTGTRNAGDYTLTLTPTNLALSGSGTSFEAGTGKSFTVNPKALDIAVSKVYDGNATFTNTNTYTITGMANSDAAPTISSGTATIASENVNTGSPATEFATNTFTLSNSNYTLTGGTVAATISQLASVTYTGSTGGAWSDGANWTVTGGVATGARPTLANVATVIIPSGVTVNYSEAMSGLTPTNAVGITNNGGVSFSNTSTVTLPAVISGAGAVTMAGSAPVILSGNNSYTGTTTINSGATLQLGAAGVIPNSSALVIDGTLDLAGYSETVGSIAGASTGRITSSASGTPVLTAGGDNSSTIYAGVIDNGSATTVALTKVGTGTLSLTGTNTNTGVTSINGGVLSVEIDANLGAATSLAFDGGTLEITGTATFTSAKTITLNGAATINNTNTTNASTFSGAITNGANLLTIDGAGNTTLSGNIGSGSGGLTKSGTGTLTLSGTNAYTGGTIINAGTVVLASTTALPSGGNVTINSSSGGSVLDLNGNNIDIGAGTLTIAGSGVASVMSSSGTPTLKAASYTVSSTGTTTISVVLADKTGTTSGLTMSGAGGTLNLNAANTYTGATTFSAGTIKLGIANAIASSALTMSGSGYFDMAGYSVSLASLSGASTNKILNSVSGTSTLTVGGAATTTFAGIIEDNEGSGTGVVAMIISGTTSLTLSGFNTYSGGTTISTGATVTVSSDSNLGASTGDLILNGGTLGINGSVAAFSSSSRAI